MNSNITTAKQDSSNSKKAPKKWLKIAGIIAAIPVGIALTIWIGPLVLLFSLIAGIGEMTPSSWYFFRRMR